jgi:TIR domain
VEVRGGKELSILGPSSSSTVPDDVGVSAKVWYKLHGGDQDADVRIVLFLRAWAGGGRDPHLHQLLYATPDRAIADEVSSWLREAGHVPFLDHELRDGISVGEDWEQRLYRELRQADAMIAVVTSSFVASNWCSAEVGIASALGSRLMPLRAEAGVVYPLMPRLQYAEYQADPRHCQVNHDRDQLRLPDHNL